MPSLHELELGADALSDPLTYPGKPSPHSALLLDDKLLWLTSRPGRRLGQYRVALEAVGLPGFEDLAGQEVALSFALLALNQAPVNSRYPVVAFGSNASPSQMTRKFSDEGVSRVVPMTHAVLDGVSVGHSAHVSRAHYIAMTPYGAPSATAKPVCVLWLDDAQLRALDRTEPNYDRVLLRSDDYPLVLRSQERLSDFAIYASKWGVLSGSDGRPYLPSSQDQLIRLLLGRSADLRALLGKDPRQFVENAAEGEDRRLQARELFAEQGWTLPTGFGPHSARPTPYGRCLGFFSPTGLRIDCTTDDLERKGEQCLVITGETANRLNLGSNAVIRRLDEYLEAGSPEAPCALGRVVHDDSVADGIVRVDQILCNAVGAEIGEVAQLTPALADRSRWSDFLVASRRYTMCRVQTADLATVEQHACLVDDLTLQLLGIVSGDEVVIEGVPTPGDDSTVPRARVKAYSVTEPIVDRRCLLEGGALDSRFPSARDALGVYPDLPWVFLDSALRTRLGLPCQKLGVIRIRAGRRYQVIKQLREMLLLLIIASLGLVTLVNDPSTRLGLLLALIVGVVAVVGIRLRSQLSHKK